MSTAAFCEIARRASRTLAGTFLASLGLMLSSAVRTVIAACARRVDTSRRSGLEASARGPGPRSRGSPLRPAASRSRRETASVTTGRAAEHEVRRPGAAAASPGRRCSRGPSCCCDAWATTSANPSSSITRVSSHQPTDASTSRMHPEDGEQPDRASPIVRGLGGSSRTAFTAVEFGTSSPTGVPRRCHRAIQVHSRFRRRPAHRPRSHPATHDRRTVRVRLDRSHSPRFRARRHPRPRGPGGDAVPRRRRLVRRAASSGSTCSSSSRAS